MVQLCRGRWPSSSVVLLVRMLVLGTAIVSAGCASRHQSQTAYSSSEPVKVAAVRAADLEDDGLPVQTPPPRRGQIEPDDASEPFSPNYGSQPARPAPIRVSHVDGDAIIAAAITAHEQRHH